MKSMALVLGHDGRYRLPRSVLRGVLRRELKVALGGSGAACVVELGSPHPCDCPACVILRGVTVMDTKGDCTKAPEIRQRIRRNPYTGIADEGALFDMETGPEGITFPFTMRYRGGKLPRELKSIIRYWGEGPVWLGGSSSTGKGRFCLKELAVYEWDLKEDWAAYLESTGFRGDERILADKISNGANKGLKEITHKFLSTPENLAPFEERLRSQWEEVKVEISVSSPMISADPVAALLDARNMDTVFYQKRVWQNGEMAMVPAIKGETVRGLLRTAVGRNTQTLGGEHDDCRCSLCEIFGNEHQTGMIRFEDLTPINKWAEKKMDHVAIDRFTGGAEDKKKFDVCSLTGIPESPLKLQGIFWIKGKMLCKEKEKRKEELEMALQDIKDGLYPMGGRAGVGYGWISDIKLTESPEGLSAPMEPTIEASPYKLTPYDFSPPESSLKAGKDEIYFPYCFIKPDSSVPREQEQTGHEKFDDKLRTGKIQCSFKTLSPLIIPDQEGVQESGEHKRYPGTTSVWFNQ